MCKIDGRGPHILLDAHIDEIGLIVTGVDDKGFVKFTKCGGADARVLMAAGVTVWGREPLFGVVCSVPPHLEKPEDAIKLPDFAEIAIDIGRGAEEAKKIVSPGDRITLKDESKLLLNGRLSGKAFDDRAGVVAVLRALELIFESGARPDLTVSFSSQEELGTRGAGPAAFSAKPEQAIAVDVSYALTPDSPAHKCGELGKGVMIGVAPALDYDMTEELKAIAAEKNIPHQLEVMGGESGTNADPISVSGDGVKSALLSVPLRYMHTAVETVSPSDIESAAKLIAEYVIKNSGENYV